MGTRSKRAGRVGAHAVLSAVLLVACNAITGVSDLGIGEDSSNGGAADGGASDASKGSHGETSNESGLSDDGGTVNVIDDGGAGDADAGPVGFCASLAPPAALCTDFDDNVFPGPWTPTTSGVATAALITSSFESSPRALHLGSTGGTNGTAFLSKTFPTVAQSEVVVGFAVRVGQQRPLENELAVIFLGSAGGNPYQVQFELLDNGVLNFEEEAPEGDGGVPEKNDALGVNLTVGVWTRVTITLAIGASSSTATFAVEGNAPVTKSALAHNYKAALRVVIGHDSATTAAYGMDFDDIFVRVK